MIKFYLFAGESVTEIKAKLASVLSTNSRSFKKVFYWIAEFERGRTICEYIHRIGDPNGVTTEEMFEKVRKIIVTDRRLKIEKIAEMIAISTEGLHNIIHKYLDISKLCARWMPRLLTAGPKTTMNRSFSRLKNHRKNE